MFINKAQTKYEFEDKTMVINNGTNNITVFDRELRRKYVGAASSTNILGKFEIFL